MFAAGFLGAFWLLRSTVMQLGDVTLPLQGAGGPSEVRVRATADRRRLYLLVQWSDPQPSYGDYWKWGAGRVWSMHKGQDGFAILWGPGGHRDQFREQGPARGVWWRVYMGCCPGSLVIHQSERVILHLCLPGILDIAGRM